MFHYGIVESNKDPQELGRVKVRVFDLHTPDKVMIPTDDLPWATVVQPTTSAANSGVGMTPYLQNGTMVMVTFADEDYQYPIIIGSIPSEVKDFILKINSTEIPRGDNTKGFQDPDGVFPTDTYKGDKDLPKLSRTIDNEFPREQFKSSNPLFDITEPEDIRSKHLYPHNQVRQSVTGHYEEWDDTPDNERINTQHKSGTFEEIRPDGTVVRKIVGNDYTIVSEGQNVYVEGVVNLHVNSNCNTYINGDWNVRVTGNHNITVDKNVNESYGGNQSTSVSGSVNESYGGSQTTTASGNIDINASRIDLN